MINNNIEIPVYIINGFLDSGKTTFIMDTITSDYFAYDALTVIFACEEGEVEYDEKILKKYDTIIEYVSRENINDVSFLAKRINQLNASRVMIEYNGMWAADLPLSFPDNFLMNQQITLVDGSTFSTYFKNNDLKSLFVNMIRESELIIFNRSQNSDALKDYLKNIKAVNNSTQVLFEDMNGFPINVRLDEDLPYDINSNHIILNDEDYGIWFIDMMDRSDVYEGKIISFKAQILKPKEIEAKQFIPGRRAMTCCAEDIQFLGFLCKYDGKLNLKNQDWVNLTAEIKIEYFKGYGTDGPILYAKEVKLSNPPDEEIIYFGNI